MRFSEGVIRFRCRGAFLGSIDRARCGVFRLSPGLLGAVLRLVVGLLRCLLHTVSCVFGCILWLVACVVQVLFCAAVLAWDRLAPSKSRCTHQGGPEKYR